MDIEIESLLRAQLRVSRELLSLRKPEHSIETAAPVLHASLEVIKLMRSAESAESLQEGDREAIREHINVSRRLLRLKAREFRFAYVDPEDGEGASPIYANILPVPASLLGERTDRRFSD